MDVFQRKTPHKKGAGAGAEAEAEAEASEASGLLGSLKKRSGHLMDRVAGSVKEATRSSLLKQAIEAHERGNLAAAFHLAKEEFDNQPDEPEVAGFYWDVSVAYERPADAASAVAGLIRKHAIGAHELAIQYWCELASRVPDAVVDPSTLARLVPHLQKQVDEDSRVEDPAVAEGEEEDPEVALARASRASRKSSLRSALRCIVDERNRGSLTAGLAMHVAELARELDAPSALAAARHALDCDELPQSKRDRLQALIAELDSEAESPAVGQVAPTPADVAPSTAASPLPSTPIEPDGVDAEGSIPPAGFDAHPARSHPLLEKAPAQPGLSDEELAALKERLPSSRTGESITAIADRAEPDCDSSPGVAPTAESPNVEPPVAPSAEPAMAESPAEPPVVEPDADPGHASEPESIAELASSLDSVTEADIDLLGDSAPDLEIDDLDDSHPDLEIDELASSFPELQVEVTTPDSAEEPADALDAEPLAVLPAEPIAEEPSAEPPTTPPVESIAESLASPSAESPICEPISTADVESAPLPIDPSAEAPLYPDLKCLPAQPSGFDDTALLIDVAGDRRARVEFELVQAIAVGQVIGLADEPVTIVDLLMDLRNEDGTPLRVVRLRDDEFDPLALMPEEPDAPAALRAFLGKLMQRTSAIPLPDPEAALGLIVPRFESLSAFEQQVLQVRG